MKYPRNIIVRHLIRGFLKCALASLTHTDIQGLTNIPRQGPFILAGNHVAVMEIVLMAAYSPKIVEFVGAGDIPIDPNFAWMTKAYGFIPVQRGMVDRSALHSALDVLKQNGVIGIFPEGGFWSPAEMQAQIGVAWMSSQGNAPVVPIGFSGMKGALVQIGKMRRPRLRMNIGRVIPPISEHIDGKTRKEALAMGAQQIMENILALLPPEDRLPLDMITEESYFLEIWHGETSDLLHPLNSSHKLFPEHAQWLAKVLTQPVLMDVFARNLHLPTQVLYEMENPSPAELYYQAVKSILDYLETNTGFFTYRYGIEEGLKMKSGMEELANLAQKCTAEHHWMLVKPIHKFCKNGDYHTEIGSPKLHKM